MPNNANNERLNRLVLLFEGELSNISGNVLAPNTIADRIHITSIIIITAEEVSLSLKNPPGYVEIKIVIIAMKTKNAMIPYEETFEKLFKIFPSLELFEFGNVKTTTKYKKANTEIIIVSNNESLSEKFQENNNNVDHFGSHGKSAYQGSNRDENDNPYPSSLRNIPLNPNQYENNNNNNYNERLIYKGGSIIKQLKRFFWICMFKNRKFKFLFI
jgi:hypothetical protein